MELWAAHGKTLAIAMVCLALGTHLCFSSRNQPRKIRIADIDFQGVISKTNGQQPTSILHATNNHFGKSGSPLPPQNAYADSSTPGNTIKPPQRHEKLEAHDRAEVWSKDKGIPIETFVTYGIAAFLLLGLGVFVLYQNNRSKQEEAEENDIVDDHPLMAKHDASVLDSTGSPLTLGHQLSIAEHIAASVNMKLYICLWISLVLAFLLIACVDHEAFGRMEQIPNIPDLNGCRDKCLNTPRSFCAGDNLKFGVQYCNKEGQCKIPEDEDDNDGKSKWSDGQVFPVATCSFKVVPKDWHISVTLVTFMVGMLCIISGTPPELILICLSCFYACVGIITPDQAFGGFSNGGVIALAILAPIATAIEETGVLAMAVNIVLGSPTNFYVALVRVMIPCIVMSAVFDSMALVVLLLPIIKVWAARLNTPPGKILLMLSYACQLGSLTTLIGCPLTLVAAKAALPHYRMDFFDLTPLGFFIAILTMLGMCVLSPLLNASNAPTTVSSEQKEATVDAPSKDSTFYDVTMLVNEGYVGKSFQKVREELERLSGVASATSPDEDNSALQANSKLILRCSAEGVVSLRQLVTKVRLNNDDDLHKLGTHRDQRALYEVRVSKSSTLVGVPLHQDSLRAVLGSCCIAIADKKSTDSVEVGDILLIETDERYITCTHAFAEEFDQHKKIPNSTPPRVYGVVDKVKSFIICGGMLTLIVLLVLDVTELSYGAGFFLMVIYVIGALSPKQIYSSLNGIIPVCLVIAGAIGLSFALANTGIAPFLGKSVVALALPGGTHCVRGALYLTIALLGLFMNNAACGAIFIPMAADIAAQTGMTTKSLDWLIIMASGVCCITPIGYQTNLYMFQQGGYTWGDFIKFGVPIQLVHMAATLLGVWVLCDLAGM